MALSVNDKMKLINHTSAIMADLIMNDIIPVSLITLSKVDGKECTGIFFVVDENKNSVTITQEACINYLYNDPDYIDQRSIQHRTVKQLNQ